MRARSRGRALTLGAPSSHFIVETALHVSLELVAAGSGQGAQSTVLREYSEARGRKWQRSVAALRFSERTNSHS